MFTLELPQKVFYNDWGTPFRWWAFGPHLNLTTYFTGITTYCKMLWVVERCSDNLSAAHYRLAHAVPMVGIFPTTEPNNIFY